MSLAAKHWQQDERRSLRLKVSVAASVRQPGSTAFDAKVLDLSMTGFRLETSFNLKPGTRVWLTLPGMQSLEAEVAWRKDFIYGCAFVQSLYPAVFDHIARRFAQRDES